MLSRRGQDGIFTGRTWRAEQQVHAGGYAGDRRSGHVGVKQAEKLITTAPVLEPQPADMPVELSRGDQIGQDPLVDDSVASVQPFLDLPGRVADRRWQGHPAKSE